MSQEYYQPPTPPTNGMAIASLITSLLGLYPVGLILGYMAKRQIDESGGAMGGRGLAMAGIIIGWIGIGLIVLVFCIWLITFLGVGGLAFCPVLTNSY